MPIAMVRRITFRVPDPLFMSVDSTRKATRPYWNVSDVILDALRLWVSTHKPAELALMPSAAEESAELYNLADAKGIDIAPQKPEETSVGKSVDDAAANGAAKSHRPRKKPDSKDRGGKGRKKAAQPASPAVPKRSGKARVGKNRHPA